MSRCCLLFFLETNEHQNLMRPKCPIDVGRLLERRRLSKSVSTQSGSPFYVPYTPLLPTGLLRSLVPPDHIPPYHYFPLLLMKWTSVCTYYVKSAQHDLYRDFHLQRVAVPTDPHPTARGEMRSYENINSFGRVSSAAI